MLLYAIRFEATHKMYVGITTCDVMTRFGQHCRSRKSLISHAIIKYGNPSVSVIAECETYEELVILEQMAIEFFQTKHPDGYNRTEGGEGLFGLKHSANSKQKISKNTKNKTEYRREQSKESNRRRIVSPETLAKKSESMLRYYSTNPCSNELRELRRINQTGREASVAAKNAISNSLKNMPKDVREKISASTRLANANRNWSSLSRARLSVSRAMHFARLSNRHFSELPRS